MKTGAFRTMLLEFCCIVILFPLCAQAGPVQIPGFYGSVVTAPPRTELPVLRNPGVLPPGITAFDTATPNKLTIRQNQEKAIIDWSSFNIGADAWTHFDQKGNANWVALNRIWSRDPSQIFGRLSADGKVYLINQNGILFGPGSKVDVHTLIASALNMKDNDFLTDIIQNKNKVLKFQQEDYQGTGLLDPLAAVSNHGEINAANGGSIFLIAPRVDNAGLINAPTGHIGLIAGTDVTLVKPASDDKRSAYYIMINDDFNSPLSPDPSFGRAVNLEGGRLVADGGIAGMYGNHVDQWGMIRSVTAFQNKRGHVELRAANKVTTGATSFILLPVDASIDPETGKIVTVSDTFDIQPVVDIKGLHAWSTTGDILSGVSARQIEHRGVIQAPVGKVTMSAAERIYLESGSRIDVRGVDVELPAPVLSLKLNSVELRDAYGQKGGVLQGQTITTSALAGSVIGDLSQLILTQDRTALERSIGGARMTTVDPSTGIVTYNNPQTGTISLTSDGDVIVKQRASLDFSGGQISYASGFYDMTKLLSGTTIYDISNAPLSLRYDKIMGQYTRTYERYGVKQKFQGIYYGGVSQLRTYQDRYTQGGEAGALTISAPRIVMDGQLDGNVRSGAFQNTWTMRGSYSGDKAASDYDVAMALSVHRGLEAPRAGTVTIDMGKTGAESSIEVLSETSPQADIQPDTPLLSKTTRLSAAMLNSAGIRELNLTANLNLSTAPGAAIRLQPGGIFSAIARRIDHQGKITVPAGEIDLIIRQNSTSKKAPDGNDNPPGNIIDLPEPEAIVLGSASLLNVSGERTDNSMVGKSAGAFLKSGQTVGGKIRIMDQTDEGEGVSIRTGAVVDVSGGYDISQKGKVTGGNAGILDIQGSAIALDGDLRGYALSDTNGKLLGGAVILRSTNIRVAPGIYSVPDTFVLAGNRFGDTGFTQISLSSFNDIVIEPNTTIETSRTRMNYPTPAWQKETARTGKGASDIGDAVPGRPDLIRLRDAMAFMAGPSLFTAAAGSAFEGSNPGFTGHLQQIDSESPARVLISQGVLVRTAPAASAVTRIANDVATSPASVKTGITLTGPNVEVRGTLASFGGTIALATMSSGPNQGHLWIAQDARILAPGYNRPDPESTLPGYAANYLPVAGGSVKLSAYNDLTLAEGSLIDISGSDTVENRIRSTMGDKFALTANALAFREAGNPGSLTVAFGNNLTWAGSVKVRNPATGNEGIRGGTLSVSQTRSELNIGAADFLRYKNYGFDDITLKSISAVRFGGAIDVAAGTLGRKLTLDAPQIIGAGQDVNMSAPWVVLTNTGAPAVTSPDGAATGELKLSGGWIDVIGSVKLGGFQDVTLKAQSDVRLSEVLYNNNVKEGTLAATGNLTLDADRVYPGSFYKYTDSVVDISGTYSDFTIIAGKKVTIQHTAEHIAGPIYSAGGSLTVNAQEGIELKKGGFLAAPLGEIKLNAPGQRIYLADGSVITTAGAGDAAIKYGFIDDGNLWMTADNKTDLTNTTPVIADNLRLKSVFLDANTVIVRDGARVDVSGGGSVFAYKFQPGASGSVDPLSKTGRFLVFKNDAFQMPGEAIYLNGGAGLEKGLYTILPLDVSNPQNARYAFMPGAYILEVQKGAALPASGSSAFTKDGYALTSGYAAVRGTSILSTRPQVYSVRTAADVMTSEGSYVLSSLVSGNAGDITIRGNTMVIDGVMRAEALSGYKGGTVSLSAANIVVKRIAGNLLPDDFDFTTAVDPDLQNKLLLTFDSLSGKGFRKVILGEVNNTSTVTIEGGTLDESFALNASVITLAARDKIDIQTNAQLNALTTKDKDSGEGVISLTTPGTLMVDSGAFLHATHDISLDVNSVDYIRGNLQVDNSAITLRSENIFFGERDPLSTAKGLYMTPEVLNRFSTFEDITFSGKNDIQFRGNTTLSASSSLTLDAAGIVDMKADGASIVSLSAPVITIRNSRAATSITTAPAGKTNRGTFTVNASNQVIVGGGDVFFDGFGTINLQSANDLALKGKGSLATRNADLNLTAARVVTAYDQKTPKVFIAPNFTVDAGGGIISMTGISGVSPATSFVPGGLLEMKGKRIVLATVLQSDGGTIKLTSSAPAGSSDGIFLNAGGRILARGTESAPGGEVILSTDQGRIDLAMNSLIDVSAGVQGDAGVVMMRAPVQGVILSGDLQGAANGRIGGSFILDTDRISGFTSLNTKLVAGGFTETVDVRVRNDNVEVVAGTTVTANRIILTADSGGIDVYGTIDASRDTGGGQVELYAANDVTLRNGSRIDIRGTAGDASGGNIFLASAGGFVNLNQGSAIDASRSGAGLGGVIHLRALRNGNDVKINLGGTLTGPSAIYAETVRVYSYGVAGGKSIVAADIGTSDTTGYRGDTRTYMNNNTASARLKAVLDGQGLGGVFTLMPGIEVRNTLGDITLGTDWDFSQKSGSSFIWRYGTGNNVPGVLTLRAKGNLNISYNLVDHPTAMSALLRSDVRDSWGYNLTAGADLAAANPLSVLSGTGNLTISNAKVVYTESAPIRFASGNDTTIGSGFAAGYMINSTMKYNLATYDGAIMGYVGRDLVINGGAIQAATGDIDIHAGRDIQLNLVSNLLGAIRTTGQTTAIEDIVNPGSPPTTITRMQQYWTYAGGGDINLDVGRSVGKWADGVMKIAYPQQSAWDYFTKKSERVDIPGIPRFISYGLFSANYEQHTNPNDNPTSGIATMGGGNLSVRTGGDFLTQAGAFGAGDLTVYAGGNIKGRFLSKSGIGKLHAEGNFGSAVVTDSISERVQIELFNSRFYVTAGGEIQISALVNPNLASSTNIAISQSSGNRYFEDCTYTPDTSISLKAGTDVTIAGKSPFYTLYGTDLIRATVLPANVSVEAGGDIALLNYLTMTSSPTGNLRLRAGGDIKGADSNGKDRAHMIMMSDIAPEYWYGLFQIYGTYEPWIQNRTVNDIVANNKHNFYKDADKQRISAPLHSGDSQAVEISAGGDIRNLKMYFPKKAGITAAGDIVDITYEGQNLHPDDVSTIRAGGNISMAYVRSSTTLADLEGLVQGGPGAFIVQAGGSIDLGILRDGIQTIGNGRYPQLGTEKSNLIIVSGYNFNKAASEIGAFFETIQKKGDEYAQLSADGKMGEATAMLEKTRQETITPFLGDPSGTGDINMTASQIGTSIGKSDIFIIANGDLNLGKTALPVSGKLSNKTGIATGGGGAISIFSTMGDVNVNESRIMTFYGGDITIWSDHGNINAGRGSRTAVSASPPKVNEDGTQVFTPPAIGSGIRAVTYGENAPEPGQIHLFAPSGIIDAGEAEISGGKVILAAQQVLNVQNIIFSSGSVGVSQTTGSTTGIGTLTGSGSTTQGSQLKNDASGIGPGKNQNASQMLDNIMTKWLDVKVIDFILNE